MDYKDYFYALRDAGNYVGAATYAAKMLMLVAQMRLPDVSKWEKRLMEAADLGRFRLSFGDYDYIENRLRTWYDIIIVTRHEGAIEWLRKQGITGKVYSHVGEYDVYGRIVVGNLPMHLAAMAREVWAIEMPNLPENRRGVDLTPAEMDSYGASLIRYEVRRVGKARGSNVAYDRFDPHRYEPLSAREEGEK